MKIAQGLEMLELAPLSGNANYHPTVIYDDNCLVLVDTGMPGNREKLLELIRNAELPADKLQAIILTHQDVDHIGSLPQFLAATANSDSKLDVYAHEADKPYIDGEKPLIKVPEERMNMILSHFPEEVSAQYRATFSAATPMNVNRLMVDGETLPFAGGVTVIHTPGHTPGHVSLYHHASKTLIAGDAMIVHEGQLHGPNPPFTPDLNLALRSLRKLAAYDIETVVCFHGGVYNDSANERIAELAAQAE